MQRSIHLRNWKAVSAFAFWFTACCMPTQAFGSCHAEERSLWTCQAGRKVYALCASQDLGPATGHLQYRASKNGKVEFGYPSAKVHPRGVFRLALLPRGASLFFTSQGHEYSIHEPLAGKTTIDVSKEGKGIAGIMCAKSSDTLTLTSTLDFFREIGVFEQP